MKPPPAQTVATPQGSISTAARPFRSPPTVHDSHRPLSPHADSIAKRVIPHIDTSPNRAPVAWPGYLNLAAPRIPNQHSALLCTPGPYLAPRQNPNSSPFSSKVEPRRTHNGRPARNDSAPPHHRCTYTDGGASPKPGSWQFPTEESPSIGHQNTSFCICPGFPHKYKPSIRGSSKGMAHRFAFTAAKIDQAGRHEQHPNTPSNPIFGS